MKGVPLAISAAIVLAAGCSDGDRVAALERTTAEKTAALSEAQSRLAQAEQDLASLKTTASKEKEELAKELGTVRVRLGLAEQRANEEHLEVVVAAMVAEASSTAFRNAGHLGKELLESRDEAEERARLIKSFWRQELQGVRRLRTLEDMAEICRAVRAYRAESGRYPASGNKELTSAIRSPRKQASEPYFKARPDGLSASGELLDAWGRPYEYVENAGRELPQQFPNRTSFLLYSLGPNGKDETAPSYVPGGDDVCNWYP